MWGLHYAKYALHPAIDVIPTGSPELGVRLIPSTPDLPLPRHHSMNDIKPLHLIFSLISWHQIGVGRYRDALLGGCAAFGEASRALKFTG